ncbi:MAG: thioredoxin domain-containing protein [Acidobacteria bacterium]|nr:thioredoxin domain-containing protein [Acidobacteriota bacterium]
MIKPKHTNALINETSPYLMQHAHNPVDWHPWGDEALSLAKKEDTPILLSIGYSACHWCHVMAHECFENEEIAALMNANFICIKVDREERPDLDSIYMTAVQKMTGSGGWPMTVFLTPDQIPFYAGTYFPPEDRYGRPGFRRVLLGIAQAYRERREPFYSDVYSIANDLRNSNAIPESRGELHPGILDTAASGIIRNYDSRNGGFGAAPKFPPAMALSYLMRCHLRKGGDKYLDIINNTLTRMACGGMYDQLGGGFHRYSVDEQWLVPHFEKMLYDNALLSRVYLDAWLLTQNVFYRKIAGEILDYAAREMTSPEGGFYSSQDADSDGKEGSFFLWTINEVKSILGEENADLFCRYFGITAEGNFEGKNILYVPRSPDGIARLNDIAEDQLQEIIDRGRKKLFDIRERRTKPGRDEKILTGWNGLMLRSFAEAANSLNREDYRRIAVRNGEFLLSKLHSHGGLLRSYKDGKSRFNAYLEDYAFLIDGLISLYESTFEARWLHEAEDLAAIMTRKFWDPQDKGFYFTSDDHESLIFRPKEFYDNAVPSGNSAAALALLRLWKLTGNSEWPQYSVSILEVMAEPMAQHPAAFPHLLCSLDYYFAPLKEIAVVGDPLDPRTGELLSEIFHRYLPNRVVACGTGGYPFLLKDRTQTEGRPTAYVCENFWCGLPVTTPQDLGDRLKSM